MKKLWRFVLFLSLVAAGLFLFRKPILRSMAAYLIYENPLPSYSPAMFVLSGGSAERGNEAARLLEEVEVDSIICTGQSIPGPLSVLGLDSTESELTALQLIRKGGKPERVRLIQQGTSTQEESDIILQYCRKHQIDHCIIVSSKFHTRRVKQVFRKRFKKEGIDVIIRGAPAGAYDEFTWWENEYGLIALNNEYLKQLYYLIKY